MEAQLEWDRKDVPLSYRVIMAIHQFEVPVVVCLWPSVALGWISAKTVLMSIVYYYIRTKLVISNC